MVCTGKTKGMLPSSPGALWVIHGLCSSGLCPPPLYFEKQTVTHQQETNEGCISVLDNSSVHFLLGCKTQQAEYLGEREHTKNVL